jgi:superfamily II DNA or RNA helicase
MITPRPYQLACIAAIREELKRHRSTLVVMATGLGKTVTFAEIARLVAAKGGRSLIVAHRGELLTQAQRKLESLGVAVGVEKASQSAADESVVVASVQSLRGARLSAWPRDAFKLVVIDEAHRATAKTYRDIVEHFSAAKVLGVTATPDRLDGQAMGDVFESCAYRYGMRDAIKDGWLVPLTAQRVHVEGLDLSAVRTVAGDLHQADLDEAMRACVDGVTEPLLRLATDRPTILFAVSVAHAHALAASINARRPGSALALDGSAKDKDRSQAIESFLRGACQHLVNCSLFTEGFDAPSTSCIAIARPTKSRALYTQMVGRGTRLAEGKSDCLILDFAGNAGKHSLAGPADVLAGDEPDEVKALAAELMTEGAIDLEEALSLAQEQVETHREESRQRRTIDWWAESVNPFLAVPFDAEVGDGKPATEKQRDYLERKGLNVPEDFSHAAAWLLIERLKRRQEAGLSTLKQARLLRRHGIDGREMSFEEAGETIGQLAQRWKRRSA